jgi:type VI secretion system secreted protein VgrG
MSSAPPAAFDSADPSLDAVFELDAGPYASGELRVMSFEGHEEMNGLYAFDVVFWTKDVDEAQLEGALLGMPASLGMHVPGGAVRWVRGVAASLVLEGKHEGARHAFRLSLVPRLWLLGKRVNSRIFQDMTVQEIVDAVLSEWGVEHDWNLLAKYPQRQYCVQYQESDLHFVTRLLAEEGILWSFEHPDGDAGSAAARLVLIDSARTYAPIAGDPGLVFRQQIGDGAMKAEEHHVLDFRLRARVEPQSVVLRDYDFRRPLLDLTSAAPDASAAPPSAAGAPPAVGRPLEIYDHHGEYEETDADTGNAGVYLEQLRAGAREADGKSVCRRLLPGHTFNLSDHDVDRLNAGWVVTHVHHHGIALELAKKGARVYENRFRCAPAEVPYRPARPPRVTKQVIESAVVVGPEGQEIFTDAYGRIKVQFHWDREGKRNEHSSCWMRVMQAWAGTGWGFQFIPRIGMEVVVSFLGGDLDRPVVMGCLANAQNPMSHALPGNATRSGIRTRSTPSSPGWNEIAFEDRAGAEQIFVHAQRDMYEETGNDHVSVVKRERRELVEGDRRSLVRGNRRDDTVGGHDEVIHGGRMARIGGSDAAQVGGHSHTLVGGDAEVRIAGRSATEVGGRRTIDVRGDSESYVHGNHLSYSERDSTCVVGATATVTVGGTLSVNAGQGLSIAVGSTEVKKSASASISGDLSLKTAGATEIVIDKEMKIRCGATTLTINPDGVTIEAKKILLAADDIEGASAKSALKMGDEVEIQGKTVKLRSEDDAILELGKEAKIDGKAVKIKPGLAAEAAEREKREEQAKTLEKETIDLFDRTGKRVQNALYEISCLGWFETGVAADGTVKIPKFPDVDRCHLRWGRPKAKREDKNDPRDYEFAMDVYLQDGGDDDEALRRKLHNLGYHGRDLTESVHAFQVDVGVERTADAADVKDHVAERHDASTPITIDKKA